MYKTRFGVLRWFDKLLGVKYNVEDYALGTL